MKNRLQPRKHSHLALALGMIMAALLLTSCVDFTVQNNANIKAYVIVQMPGTSGSRVNVVEANGSYGLMSLYGGNFTIKVLPDQEYLTMLENARVTVKQMLDQAHGNPDAPPGEWKKYWDQWIAVAGRIQEIEMTGASCSGTVQDFGTVTATLTKSGDQGYAGQWTVSCWVENPEVSEGE